MNSIFHYTQEEIGSALREVGLQNGDIIFTHSNVGFFGILKNATTPSDYYQAFKTEIIKVIGNEGTFIMPTFTYSYCWNQVYDKKNSPSTCGLLSEEMRKDKEVLRSNDPNFSICALGKDAEYFVKNPDHNSFGKNSIWSRFYKKQGKFVNFNFDSASTFVHFAERELEVDYRYDKAFDGTSIIGGREILDTYYHYVYDLEKPETGPDFTKFDYYAKTHNYTKTGDLGRGQIVLITAQDMFSIIKEQYKINPQFFIKSKQ